MDSTFNLAHFWSQGDGFAHFTTVLLLLMSVVSWTVIVVRLLMWRRLRHLPRAVAAYWLADSATRVNTLSALDGEQLLTPMARLAAQGGDDVARERQLAHAVRQAQNRLEQGLTLLATIASSAPFVGLLGTVWGIYRTLTQVAAQGQLDMAGIVGPVGEALIMTAAGLAVALPALFAYNFFNRSNHNHAAEIEAFAHDVLNQSA
ncbi:MAG: MotA/TolQ/ExbB proton channel family protein [Formosimonas sp.]